MAYYFIFPEKDATLYSHPDRLTLNTGHDEILEVVKEKGTSDARYYPSRALVQFKNEDIKSTITDKIGSFIFNSNASCSLQLSTAEHKNLPQVLNLEVFAISQSWNEGSGKFSDIPAGSNGCSWTFRDSNVEKTQWLTGSSSTTGLTFGTSSIVINEIPSGSAHELIINGVDFVPVLSASLFDSSNNETYVEISSSIDAFGLNLRDIINLSSSLTLVSASYDTTTNTLNLSGSSAGTNVTISTSSISGNNQPIFSTTVGNFSVQGATSTTISVFAAGSSGSINATGITEGGGVWYTGSGFTATQQFLPGDSLDTDFDVTDIVKKYSASLFVNQTYPDGIFNNGFLVKQPDIIETNTSTSFGQMQYFSTDTNTIYPPKLVFKWDDSSHGKQSLAKQSGELNVTLYRNQEEYNQNAEAIFRVHVRDKYPTRQFASSSNFLNVGYFTTSSFYSIRDAHTEQEIIPFDHQYTKLSADDEGMFFKVFMNGLQPERYYRVLFKHTNNEGTRVYDNNYFFKVIR